MLATESAKIILQADIPWSVSYFLLGPISVIAAFVFYQLMVPGLLKWRNLKDELIVVLTQYANYVVYVVEVDGKRKLENDALYERVNQELRKLAGEVETLRSVFLYKLWVKLRWLPTEKRIEDIRGSLIGWSNSLVEKARYDLNREIFIESLKKHLGMSNILSQLQESQRLDIENARNH